jgi:uncharacterized membrane protein
MKYKHILIVFIIGMIATTIGAFIKIIHWPMSNLILTIGMLLEVISGILLIIKLVNNKSTTDFLNK